MSDIMSDDKKAKACADAFAPFTYPKWLRDAASKGGKKSRRKLSKKEATRIALIGVEKRKNHKKKGSKLV